MIGNNSIAVEAAENKASKGLQYDDFLDSVEGEAKEVGIVFSSLMKEVMKSDRPVRKPACIIAGGETTVTVNANAATGNGGRQQELALSAATCIMGMSDDVGFPTTLLCYWPVALMGRMDQMMLQVPS